MANFINPHAGPWGNKDPFTHGELNDIVEQLLKAPNFDDGSAHTPTGDIQLDGSNGKGFDFQNNVKLDGFVGVTSLNVAALDGIAGAVGFAYEVGVFALGRLELNGGTTSKLARLKLATRSRMSCTPKHFTGSGTLNVGLDGSMVVLGQPSSALTLTIAQASDTYKEDGDFVDIYLPKPGTDPASHYWAIKREGSANNICILWGKYLPTAGSGETYPGYCRIYLRSGVWRLAGGAGVNYDTDA